MNEIGPEPRPPSDPDSSPLTWAPETPPAAISATGPIVRGAMVFYFGMGAVGALWMHQSQGAEVWGTRLLGPRPELSAALGIAGGLLLVAVTRALEDWGPVARMQEGFSEVLGPVTWSGAALLALVSALGEEFLFRGALQPWVGPWIASAIFGALHIPFDRAFLSWPIFAFVAGVGLAFATELSGSLLAPVIAHFLVNFINLRHLTRDRASSPRAE